MSRRQRKTIITCAITGAIHTPTMSDALPYRPEDIADQAIAAAEAGASVLHLHARNPENGSVSIDPEHFKRFLPVIKQATDAVINVSTGGSLLNTMEERIAPAKWASPERKQSGAATGVSASKRDPWMNSHRQGGSTRATGFRFARLSLIMFLTRAVPS